MKVTIKRESRETQLELTLSNESTEREINMPCGFLTHMLELLSHRAGLELRLKGAGDTEVDAHHLAEDTGIVLGQALRKLAAERAVARYGWTLLPMDGSLAQVALDFSGRGGCWWKGSFPSQKCGDFDMELVPEFFSALAREAGLTLHITLLAADNSHHAAEAAFKGVGVALKLALSPSEAEPSTKGLWL